MLEAVDIETFPHPKNFIVEMMWFSIPPILLNLLTKYKFFIGLVKEKLLVTSEALQMYEVKILP